MTSLSQPDVGPLRGTETFLKSRKLCGNRYFRPFIGGQPSLRMSFLAESTALQASRNSEMRDASPSYRISLFGKERELDCKTAGFLNRQGQVSMCLSLRNIKFADALKPNSPGVERVHCRLAMAMLWPAALQEATTAETILQQFAHPDWRLVLSAALVVYATMIPVLKGAKDEDFFGMTVLAEKVNGRVAMIGWAVLIGLEWYSDVCFF